MYNQAKFCWECGTLIPDNEEPYVDDFGNYFCSDCVSDGCHFDCMKRSEFEERKNAEDELNKCTCHVCKQSFTMDSNTYFDANGHPYCNSCFDDLLRGDYDPYDLHEDFIAASNSSTMINLSA